MDYKIIEARRYVSKHKTPIFASFVIVAFIGVILQLNTSPASREFVIDPNVPQGSENSFQVPSSADNSYQEPSGTTQTISQFDIVNTYVRKGTQYYTEGLVFVNKDTLLESAGLYKQSRIQYLKLPDLTIIKSVKLDDQYFGEGCQIYEENGAWHIYQLTWRERKILAWNTKDLSYVKTIDLPQPIKEGWGITLAPYTNSKGVTINAFYISDGTSNIYIVNPPDFKVLKTLPVKKLEGTAIINLNELEFVKGKIWANIYTTTLVAIVDPKTGLVDTIIDFSKLKTLATQKAKEMGLTISGGYVLNGIAYNKNTDTLILAGKKWPLMWEVKVGGV